jgi:hypothetical protein
MEHFVDPGPPPPGGVQHRLRLLRCLLRPKPRRLALLRAIAQSRGASPGFAAAHLAGCGHADGPQSDAEVSRIGRARTSTAPQGGGRLDEASAFPVRRTEVGARYLATWHHADIDLERCRRAGGQPRPRWRRRDCGRRPLPQGWRPLPPHCSVLQWTLPADRDDQEVRPHRQPRPCLRRGQRLLSGQCLPALRPLFDPDGCFYGSTAEGGGICLSGLVCGAECEESGECGSQAVCVVADPCCESSTGKVCVPYPQRCSDFGVGPGRTPLD